MTLPLPILHIVALAVTAVWLATLLLSAVSRAKHPEDGLRRSEHHVIFASIALAIAWGVAFDAKSLLTSAQRVNLESATPVAQSNGSCALVTEGMSADEAGAKLGKPDSIRNDEKTRGPGAETWVFNGSRCAVHILAGKVETVE